VLSAISGSMGFYDSFSNSRLRIDKDIILDESIGLVDLVDRGDASSFVKRFSVGHASETFTFKLTGREVVESSRDIGVNRMRVSISDTNSLLTVMSDRIREGFAHFIGITGSIRGDGLHAGKAGISFNVGSVDGRVTESIKVLISEFRAEVHDVGHFLVVDDPSFNFLSGVVDSSSHDFTGHLNAVQVSLLVHV